MIALLRAGARTFGMTCAGLRRDARLKLVSAIVLVRMRHSSTVMRPPYLKPDSPELCLEYAEPHEEFVRGAARLHDTVTGGA